MWWPGTLCRLKLEMEGRKDLHFAVYGSDYDYKYWLFCDDPDDEEYKLKFVHSVYENAWEDGVGMPLSYLEQVVLALHSKGPPTLTHLAIKRVLELELPQDELSGEIKDIITKGPEVNLNKVTERGRHLLEVLRRNEEEHQASRLQAESDEEESDVQSEETEDSIEEEDSVVQE